MAVTTAEPVSGITRREFLYYIWGASISLYLAQMGGLIIWFAIPRIKEGTFGGIIRVEAASLPEKNGEPFNNAAGRFWLVNLDTTIDQGEERMHSASDENNDIVGVQALYKVCTHLGCIYAWNAATNRFECPCHGSKYRLDGRRIQDPAPRNLDLFPVEAVDIDDNRIGISAIDGDTGIVQPLLLAEAELANVAAFKVDTGQRVDGQTRTLLKDLTGSP